MTHKHILRIQWFSHAILITVLLLQVAPVSAQSEKPFFTPSLEFEYDLRSRLAAGGKDHTGLYSGSIHLKTDLPSNLTLDLNAVRKDKYLMGRGCDFLLLSKATLEKAWGTQRLQGGVIRLPFGIYDYRETYASGLIDYPLPRVDYALNAVDWGVPGATWTGGSPKLQWEVAGFEGNGIGVWGNRTTVGGGSVRAQTYVDGLILGASHWNGYFDLPTKMAPNTVVGPGSPPLTRTGVRLNGIDARYTLPHLTLRGEYLFGVLGGRQMHGFYLDTYYHLPKYQKWTLVTRIEALRPGTGMAYGKQLTLGARYTLSPEWILSVNWRKNNTGSAYPGTWTPASGTGGNFLFQVYRKQQF